MRSRPASTGGGASTSSGRSSPPRRPPGSTATSGLTRVETGETLQALDAYLCELKEMQIRDGLHVLGASPEGRQRVDTLVAIARAPRTGGRPADASLHRAIAADLGLAGFDPLDCDLAAAWDGPRPEVLGRGLRRAVADGGRHGRADRGAGSAAGGGDGGR